MLQRIMGVFKLDVNTFEEIEADQSATSQAAIIVVIVALISGLGSGVAATLGESGGSFIASFGSSIVTTLVGWVAWSAITYFVGTSVFGGKSDMGEMLRVIGFAYAPQILGIVPCIGTIIGAIWTLVAGFVAVRQGLDLDNTKAFLTILVGLFAYIAISIIVSLIFGAGAVGIGALTGAFSG